MAFGQLLPTWVSSLSTGSGKASAYEGRSCRPEETVRRMWPYLPRLGITRLARQTGLDRIGIPCWAAFRPNAKTLAGSQGKGLTDAAACASAMMEAAEVAIAENPRGECILATADELSRRDEDWFDPERLLPIGSLLPRASPINWLRGSWITGAQPVWIPSDALDLNNAAQLNGICKTSSGLASGNTYNEALFHGLCEVVERDGAALWSFRADDAASRTCFDPMAFGDPTIDDMIGQIRDAGLQVVFFDQTTDLGIPVIMAVIGAVEEASLGTLELTAGYGAHPVAAKAAIRAITEAAQSRVTSIAASRDDIHSASFERTSLASDRALLKAVPQTEGPRGSPSDLSLSDLLGEITRTLSSHGCRVAAARLATSGMPFEVVKILSPDLEDRAANKNWRPGWRSFDAVAAMA